MIFLVFVLNITMALSINLLRADSLERIKLERQKALIIIPLKIIILTSFFEIMVYIECLCRMMALHNLFSVGF